MADNYIIDAQARTITGKKVSQLRNSGLVPAVVYGASVQPVHVQIAYRPLEVALMKAGGTSLITLNVGDSTHTVITRDVQRDILRGKITHVDFLAVSATTLIKTEVPVHFINESPAIALRLGVLTAVSPSIEIEALSGDLIDHVDVDLVRREFGRQLLAHRPQPALGGGVGRVAAPAQAEGVDVDPELATALASALAPDEAAIALLQIVAARAWSRRAPAQRSFTRDALDALGGVGRALAAHAGRAGPPQVGEVWRVGLSRVEWQIEHAGGHYTKRPKTPEDNWTWTPQGVIDMHRPERWGRVQFAGAKGGRLRADGARPARDALQEIYYAQRAYRKTHGRWAAQLAELGLAVARSHVGAPRLRATANGWEAAVELRVSGAAAQTWRIRQDARVWAEN